MLFDDDEQVEVRHVISLAHHDVSIYSGGDMTPEGELFIKRNAICLSRTTHGVEVTRDSQISKPFYLFSENCSAKEDFYFALLRNQEQDFHAENKAPRPLQFDVKNIISLVQKLHSNEEQMQTRWLNAMIGRIFLGVYQTKDIESLIRAKLTKKIARVKRPSFLSGIAIQKISTGDSAPYITNPRLKDLNVEGECTAEADVRYTGNFRIEVAATARIDLGSRFKAREVNLVLAVVLKKLEGHILFKIKPPPSNRIWFSFQQMPKMEMALEPIISSRQITYTVILRQIESRIKEVIAETLVLPFWDDIPFFRTEHKKWRGGIWEGDDAVEPIGDVETAVAQDGDIDEVGRFEENPPLSPTTIDQLPHVEKSHSLPVLQDLPQTSGLFGRKLNSKSSNLASKASASSTSVDAKTPEPARTRVQRSASFVQPPTPTTETNAAHADLFKPSSSPPSESPAADAMAMLSARSSVQTPAPTPTAGSSHRPSVSSQVSAPSSASSREATDTEKDKEQTPKRRDTVSSKGSATATPDSDVSRSGSPGLSLALRGSNTGSLARNFFVRKDQSHTSVATAGSASTAGSSGTTPEQPKRNALAAMSNAAATAKRWGISALQRHGDSVNKDGTASSGNSNNNNNNNAASASGFDLSKPMGGGRPLPPPGTPLPGPDRKKSKTLPISITRKKVLPPPLPERPSETGEGHAERKSSKGSDKDPPPLPQRQQQQQQQQQQNSDVHRRPVPPPPLPKRRMMAESPPQSDGENMLVVEAPTDSEPTTPDGSGYGPPWAGEMSDDEEARVESGPGDDASEHAKDDSLEDETPEEVSGEEHPMATPTALPNEETIIAPPVHAASEIKGEHGHRDGEQQMAAADGDEDDDDVSAWMDHAEDDHEAAHQDEHAQADHRLA